MTLSAKMRHCAVAAIILGSCFVAAADTIHVPGDQPTIQAGIDVAQSGDEVVVAPGVYNEVINFNGKAITVRSSDGRDVTTIDGTGLNDSVVKCISGEGPDTVLSGFMISGGTGDPTVNADSTVGGGMRVEGSGPTVENCIFTANTCSGGEGEGGGIYVAGGGSTLRV